MCESNVYLIKNGQEELVLESVSLVRPQGNKLFLQSILGEEKSVQARIKEINLMDHKIILEEMPKL
ncbi:MAG TPA: CooT family nickel-binding protein [Planctomycetota bacterium]|nr:CooT family nickel-binding protein [Planctomycetota bacterium]